MIALKKIIPNAWELGISIIQMVFVIGGVIMIYRAINGLIRHAIEADLITKDDIFVVRNQLMDILKLTDWNDKEPLTGNIEELLEPLIDYAVKAGIIEDSSGTT